MRLQIFESVNSSRAGFLSVHHEDLVVEAALVDEAHDAEDFEVADCEGGLRVRQIDNVQGVSIAAPVCVGPSLGNEPFVKILRRLQHAMLSVSSTV